MARRSRLDVLRRLTVATLLASGCRRVEVPPAPRETIEPKSAATEVTAQPEHPPPLVVPGPDFSLLAERLSPSVVTVISTVPREGGRRNKVVRGLGSGMIVGANGQILTNEHVVAWATRVDVELSTGERLPARVLVAEPLLDLALLELDGAPGDLTPVAFRDAAPRPGEWVMAIGQPFGLGDTLTVGVISGLGRDHDDLGRPDGLRADGLWNFIQTDASINIGNSGGPLVDIHGRVVGITTAVRSDGQGLAFATPGEMGRRFLDEARTHGRVRRTRLGIKAENATGIDLPGNGGSVVRITHVDADGPAARAGLERDDHILEIDGQAVRRVSEVAYLAQLRGVGMPLHLTVIDNEGSRKQAVIVPVEGSSDNGR